MSPPDWEQVEIIDCERKSTTKIIGIKIINLPSFLNHWLWMTKVFIYKLNDRRVPNVHENCEYVFISVIIKVSLVPKVPVRDEAVRKKRSERR